MIAHAQPASTSGWTIGLLLAVVLGTLAFLPKDGFWIVDNENKRIQLDSIATSPDWTLNLSLDALNGIDIHRYPALPPPFSLEYNGLRFSQYSPLFPLLSLPGYRLFGDRGLALLPLLGLLGLLTALRRIAQILEMPSRAQSAALAAAVLLTPIWFYSLTFWELLPALGLLFWGLFHFMEAAEGLDSARWKANLLVFTASALREEYLLIAILANLFLLARRPAAIRTWLPGLLGTAIPVLGLTSGFLRITTGRWTGYHAAANAAGLTDWMSTRISSIYNLWLAINLPPVLTLLLCLPPVLLLFFPALGRRLPNASILFWACLTAILYGFRVLSNPEPILGLLNGNSFLPAAPFLFTALLCLPPPEGRPENARKMLRQTLLLFGLSYTLLAPEISTQGIHWGARFLLPLYPGLALLGTDALSRLQPSPSRMFRLSLLLLIILSFGLQVISLHLLNIRKQWSAQFTHAIEQTEEPVIITDVWWAGHAAWSQVLQRPIYLVRTPEDLQSLRERLSEHPIETALFLTRPSEHTPEQASSLRIPGAQYWDLAWYPISL